MGGTGDTMVELRDLPVLRVRADPARGGPSGAFDELERRLPTLRHRKFYGIFFRGATDEVYYACAVREESDPPNAWGCETGVIPGGWYLRRRVGKWAGRLEEIPREFRDMARGRAVDDDRPSLEYYRREAELLLFLPVRPALGSTGPSPRRSAAAYDLRASSMDDEGRATSSGTPPPGPPRRGGV